MKVPCGGFDLDESVFNVDKNAKQVKLNSPISYDYMPEGYPKKGIGTVTLMEEQEVSPFTDAGEGLMKAVSPVILELAEGDNLTVVWDGVSYNVKVKTPEGAPPEALAFGNLGLTGIGNEEDYPFVYAMIGSKVQWATADTATSHTIKVMRQQVEYTPIDVNYMPEGYPKKNVKIDTFEEQEVTFSSVDSVMGAQVSIGFEIAQGDKLTVVWDGANYDVIVKKITVGPEEYLAFGNLGLLGDRETTDYPFAYRNGWWFTADTATSHTIGVTRQQEIITPMSTDFMPKNLNVVFKKESGSTTVNCNVTYNELRDWVERDVPVFAVFIDAASSPYSIYNITGIALLTTDMLGFAYYISGSASKSFAYKSDGTIEIQQP